MKLNFYLQRLCLTAIVLCPIHALAVAPDVKKLNTCIAAAQEIFDIFNFKRDSLKTHCGCVREKKSGQLPVKKSEWLKTGSNSMQSALVECAETSIVEFFDDAVFKSARTRLTKNGVPIEKIKRFSHCVAPYAYEEVYLSAATEDSALKSINKDKLRKNYSYCESKIN